MRKMDIFREQMKLLQRHTKEIPTRGTDASTHATTTELIAEGQKRRQA